MTLVFAKERSEEGVKEALFSRRTLGFFGNQLMGPEDLITDLFKASVIVNPPFMESESNGEPVKHLELKNPTNLTFILSKKGEDETIIAVANWSDKNEKVSLLIDWLKLGIDSVKCDISIPEIKDYQTDQTTVSLDKITIPGKKGFLILLKRK